MLRFVGRTTQRTENRENASCTARMLYLYCALFWKEDLFYATSQRHQNQKVGEQTVQNHRRRQGPAPSRRPAPPLPDQKPETPPQPAGRAPCPQHRRVSHPAEPPVQPLIYLIP